MLCHAQAEPYIEFLKKVTLSPCISASCNCQVKIAARCGVCVCKGYIIDVASMAGGSIPIDPLSLKPPYNRNYNIKRFMADCARAPACLLTSLTSKVAMQDSAAAEPVLAQERADQVAQ